MGSQYATAGFGSASPQPASEGGTLAAFACSSTGRHLDTGTRRHFEGRFRHDFSQVRIHTDRAAERAADALSARAFAFGEHLVFGARSYRPQTVEGQLLIAHELAHVVQQAHTSAAPASPISNHTDADELQAQQAARLIRLGERENAYASLASHVTWESSGRPGAAPIFSAAGAVIQRIQLTYDDGPDTAGNTATVLRELNAANAHATFYLVGKRVVQGDNWRTVFDMAATGHWLGNHAYDWNDATDNHVWLTGTTEQRAQKILLTEWAIRDALIRGRDDAKKTKTWDAIPQPNRNYIEDVIAHGTGRFRTPGFKSKLWKSEEVSTAGAIGEVNEVLAAAGLRALATTEVSTAGVAREGVTIDPEDWKGGRTQAEIGTGVTSKLGGASESILLHSRVAATAAATPAIVAEIKKRGLTFDPTVVGALGARGPRPGFAGLSKISDPPTSAEIATARSFLRSHKLDIGPVLSGFVAIGILQMAQRAGSAEVDAFVAEIRATTVSTPAGPVPLANWLNENEEWRLFASFYENWALKKPFPRIPGVTL